LRASFPCTSRLAFATPLVASCNFSRHYTDLIDVPIANEHLRNKSRLQKPRSKNDVTVLPFLVDDAVITEWKAAEKDGYVVSPQQGERVRAMLIELAASSGIRIVDTTSR
jgi:hypothetical protein